jgi:hypothetical protein
VDAAGRVSVDGDGSGVDGDGSCVSVDGDGSGGGGDIADPKPLSIHTVVGNKSIPIA